MRRTLPLALVLCSLAGCTSPAFREVPAGEAIASPPLGLWQVDWKATDPEKKLTDRPPTIFAIGRKRGAPDGLLEAVAISVKDDELDVNRSELRAVTLGGRSYASLRDPSSVHYDEYWFLFRYDVLEDGRIRAFVLDEARVKADVRDKVVSGVVNEPHAGILPGWVPVEVNAGPGPLATYLEKRGDAIFAKDRSLVLKRLHLE
jgi:hypothetical protein